MLDAINLEVCRRLHEDLERVSRISAITTPALAAPISVPLYVVNEETVHSNRNPGDFSYLSASRSRPSNLALSACGSATLSPQNSDYKAPQPPTSDDTTKLTAAKADTVYDSLVAMYGSGTAWMPRPEAIHVCS